MTLKPVRGSVGAIEFGNILVCLGSTKFDAQLILDITAMVGSDYDGTEEMYDRIYNRLACLSLKEDRVREIDAILLELKMMSIKYFIKQFDLRTTYAIKEQERKARIAKRQAIRARYSDLESKIAYYVMEDYSE